MAERKNIMDVTKPGKSAASATARPIIIGHGAMIKDPMVKDDSDSGSTSASAAETEHLEVKHEKTVLRPSPETPTGAVEAPKAESATAANQPAPESEAGAGEQSDDAAETETKPEEAKSDDDTGMGSEEAIVDAVAGQATKKSKDIDTKDSARAELVKKLTDEKTYVLPIKQGAVKGGNSWLAALLAIVVVGALAGYALVDLGTIKPGFDVPYHILKKEAAVSTAEANSPVVTAPAPTTTTATTTKFTNAELALSFEYPSEWGETALSVTKDVSGTVGSSAVVTFTKQPKIRVGLLSKDYKDKRQYIQAPCVGPGFTAYKPATSALDNGLRVVLSKADRQVVEELTAGLCDDLQLRGDVKFIANKVYPGLEVRYSDRVTDKFDLAQRITDYEKDNNKYFNDSLRQQIVTLTNSVKEI